MQPMLQWQGLDKAYSYVRMIQSKSRTKTKWELCCTMKNLMFIDCTHQTAQKIFSTKFWLRGNEYKCACKKWYKSFKLFHSLHYFVRFCFGLSQNEIPVKFVVMMWQNVQGVWKFSHWSTVYVKTCFLWANLFPLNFIEQTWNSFLITSLTDGLL